MTVCGKSANLCLSQHCYDFHPEYTCVLVNGALRTVLAKQKTITSSISINRMCVSSTTKPPLGPVFLVLVVGMSSGPSNCSSRPWAVLVLLIVLLLLKGRSDFHC